MFGHVYTVSANLHVAYAASPKSLVPQFAALSEPATSALTPHAKPGQQYATFMP
jgi:hypothetical protein